MYVEIGDQIALQYGGSEAHKKVASAGATSNIPGQLGKHKELLTSIRRYYSNAFTDRLKQDAMNLFLGYYVPSQNTTPLWELDNDYYLHNFHVNAGRGSLQSMKAYQAMFGVDWDELEEEKAHKRNESVGSLAEDAATIDRVKQRCLSQNVSLQLLSFADAIDVMLTLRSHHRMPFPFGGRSPFKATFKVECGCTSAVGIRALRCQDASIGSTAQMS